MHGVAFSDRYGSYTNQSPVIVAILSSVIEAIIHSKFLSFVRILFFRSIEAENSYFSEDLRVNTVSCEYLRLVRTISSRSEFSLGQTASAVLLSFLVSFAFRERKNFTRFS